MDDFRFNISEELKRNIASSINDAIGPDLDHAKKSLCTSTQNYAPNLTWDLINTNLTKKVNCESVIFSTKKRGFWAFLLMFDKESNKLITLMRKDRLEDVIRNNRNETPHYLNALSLLNKKLNPKIKQKTLFDMSKYQTNKYDQEQLAEMLNELCNDFEQGNMLTCNHIVVIFLPVKGQLCSLDAIALNSNLEIVAEDPWSEFITPSYDFIDEDESETTEEPEITITLTPKSIKKKEQKEQKKEAIQNEKKNEKEEDKNLLALKEQKKQKKKNIDQNGEK